MAALAVAFLFGTWAAPAAAPTPAPAAAPAAEPAVVLVDQPSWVVTGEPFEVRVQVTGAPPGAQLEMVVHERLWSRGDFRATLEGDLGGVEDRVVEPRPVADLPAAPGGAVTLGFTPGTPGAMLSGQGVYPVVVRLLSADGAEIGGVTTYLTYLKQSNRGFEPLQVAVVVDVGAPPALQPDGQPALTPGALARARQRAEVLDGAAGVPLTLAPVPETIEALADTEPEGLDVVTRIRDADRRVVARPFVDVDPAALAGAGLRSEVDHQARGGADVVRSRLGTEPLGGIWVSGPTLGAEGARLVADHGYRYALVPPSAVDRGDGGDGARDDSPPLAPVRLTDEGPLAMVSDTALAEHLTSQEGAVAAHRFVAELAITWLEAPANRRAVAVHIPGDAALDSGVVTRALSALADDRAAQAVDVVYLDQLFDAELDVAGGTVAAAPHTSDDRLGEVAGALAAVRGRVTGVGSVLDNPDEGASLDHSLLVSAGTDTPDDRRTAYVERVQGAVGSIANQVVLPEEFRITLTTRSSEIPVRLNNLSERDLTVRIVLDGDQLEFPEGDVLTEVLPPGARQLEVPVRTRTSGAFTLRVTVTSPDGSIVFDTSTFDVRSTVISGVGIVLSIGAGLFLAIWWARYWRSSRRSRHLMPAPGADGEGAVPSAPPPEPASQAPYRPAHMAGHRSRGS